jgi:hypothetical protein
MHEIAVMMARRKHGNGIRGAGAEHRRALAA